MYYQSTRSKQYRADSAEAVLNGLAPDGGLYAPVGMEQLSFDWKAVLRMDTREMAVSILSTLLPEFSVEEMRSLVNAAYQGKFETDDLTPTVSVGEDTVLELFRGPTSAFKDVALSMLPHLLCAAKAKKGVSDRILILTATSGDTGKAAMEGFCDVPGTAIIVFYPHGGVSAVQQAQMATQNGGNVKVAAIRGNFDDAQTAVKLVFAKVGKEALLKDSGVRLSSANSINIGRLAPQIVYYFRAYADLVQAGRIAVGDPVDFVVPTGNFGDILAGWFAKLLGLPVGKLVCASNENHILTDFLTTGRYDKRRDFKLTSSPSMDILVSSNLERLLYMLSGDEALIAELMTQLSKDGFYQVPASMLAQIRELFWAGWCDDRATKKTIGQLWAQEHYLCDTHTAVAWNVAQQYKAANPGHAPVVVLSTASAYKFPAAVLEGLGQQAQGDEFAVMEQLERLTGVPIPKNLRGLQQRPVRHSTVIDREEILSYVLERVKTF